MSISDTIRVNIFLLLAFVCPCMKRFVWTMIDPKHLTLGVLNEESVNKIGTCSLMQTKNCFLDGGVPVSCLLLERLKEKTFELVIFTNTFFITLNALTHLFHFNAFCYIF